MMILFDLLTKKEKVKGQPQSRNEELAALMRRMKICEERGSGNDKVIFQIELYQLPPLDFRVTGGSTIAVLFQPANLSEMGRQEKVRACYHSLREIQEEITG